MNTPSKPVLSSGQAFLLDARPYYFNARWYDPKIGRFISEDPIRSGDNWYAYCYNNPINYIDPHGLWGLSGGYSMGPAPGASITSTIGAGSGGIDHTNPDNHMVEGYDDDSWISELDTKYGDEVNQFGYPLPIKNYYTKDADGDYNGSSQAGFESGGWGNNGIGIESGGDSTGDDGGNDGGGGGGNQYYMESKTSKATTDDDKIERYIEIIQSTDWSKTDNGEKIVKLLIEFHEMGKIKIVDNRDYSGLYKPLSKSILINREIHPSRIPGVLVHEGSHALDDKNDDWVPGLWSEQMAYSHQYRFNRERGVPDVGRNLVNGDNPLILNPNYIRYRNMMMFGIPVFPSLNASDFQYGGYQQ